MSKAQVRTMRPDGSDRRYLGAAGPVTGLRYSFSLPGGCDQMSLLLGAEPDRLIQALKPGRITEVVLGGSVVWDGKLDKPSPGADGWQVSAHGSGTWGSDFTADYSGAWGAAAFDTCLNNAISSGLGWVNPGISGVSGLWAGQAPDSGSLMIDALLNQGCAHGGLTWYVRRQADQDLLQLVPLPTAPTRLLVCADPVAPSTDATINRIKLRYQSAPDLSPAGSPATFALTSVSDQASIDAHGPMETYVDLSSAGVMTAGNAQAVGSFVLQRFQGAALAGPFTARPGQLLTLGGQPAELGAFWQGTDGAMVCRLLLADQGYGGEVGPGPTSFLAGGYDYDEDAQAVSITPFASLRQDFAAFLADRAAQARGRKVVINKHGRKVVTWSHHHRHVKWVPTWHFK
jgi:hypothetical protein